MSGTWVEYVDRLYSRSFRLFRFVWWRNVQTSGHGIELFTHAARGTVRINRRN